MERISDSQTWYAVFYKSTSRRWWKLFLNPEFSHVLLITEINGECIALNSLTHIVSLRHYKCSVEDLIKQEADGATAILMRTVHYGMVYDDQPIEPLTCVTLAKRALGIRKRIVTPYGLYRELLKAGASVIKPYI